jgi:polyphosphate kinase 2 (PPK2 family)
MFETAELGASISKSEYKERAPILREELLALQLELRECGGFPVILVFAGVDGGGKGSTVNLLNEWMDPRWLVTHAYGEPSGEERERPEHWRFWRDLPPKGQIGLFLSSWYSRPILDRAYRRINQDTFARELDRIAQFETTLADDGALILKFWMHLSKSAQKQRLQTLEEDPLTQWRVSKSDWAHWKRYAKFVEAAERTILRTNTGKAPWAQWAPSFVTACARISTRCSMSGKSGTGTGLPCPKTAPVMHLQVKRLQGKRLQGKKLQMKKLLVKKSTGKKRGLHRYSRILRQHRQCWIRWICRNSWGGKITRGS